MRWVDMNKWRPDFSYFWHGVRNFIISCSQWCSQFVLHTCPLFVLCPYVLPNVLFMLIPQFPMCIANVFLNLSLWMHTQLIDRKKKATIMDKPLTSSHMILWCIINFEEEKKKNMRKSQKHYNVHQINKSGGLKVH